MISKDKKNYALITGINGQDGYYLSKLLVSKGYYVIGLARQDSNSNPNFENIEIINTDYSSADLEKIIKAYPIKHIYNLAGQTLVSKSWTMVDETITSQAMISLELLKILSLKEYSSIKLIQASSSEIFDDQGQELLNELSPLKPINPYGCAKAFSFHLVNMFRERYGIFACNAILFPHESARRDPLLFMRKLISTAQRISDGSDETLYLGNINITRDWGYAPEFADAMFAMANASHVDNYCICTSKGMNLRDIVEIVFNFHGLDMGEHVEIDQSLNRYYEHDFVLGDNQKIKKELGWSPKLFGKNLIEQLIRDEQEIFV